MIKYIFKDCDICNNSYSNSKTIAVENDYQIVSCNKCKFIYVQKQPIADEGKVVEEYYEGVNDEKVEIFEKKITKKVDNFKKDNKIKNQIL